MNEQPAASYCIFWNIQYLAYKHMYFKQGMFKSDKTVSTCI